MLDNVTKRRIDSARDILVGKVPDPKSQVEQITIALIYKFMDDMDAQSEEFGGKRKFFTKEFAQYGWAKLMHSGKGGVETINLYGEAIAKMPENPGIPPLFRDIFKNAYLPYRDPETLRSFLKIIDEFRYDHSERLGDAFEYLLSVLGSQGDAGQFRTPRHIIDFIVAILDPKKNEKVLDPACGTAGFLISSYKHIIEANKDAKGNSTLTPDEKVRLAKNFTGYDISPDMVRLSLVNMYLHGLPDPHIHEYDTLTSQDRWNETADVILANPPFMSPTGGIKPHNRFSVQSKRSEVLFVDYIAEHLTPTGRAGIIVPEGVIFQSQTAYVKLRKMLVEEYLVAVISLPAGVFNPYSGVKTSILILDNSVAKLSDTVAFFKVENDGYELGAQRRALAKSDLPDVLTALAEYRHERYVDKPTPEIGSSVGKIVLKNVIAKNDEYNLNSDRYHNGADSSALEWHMVALGEICTVERGASPRPIHDFITDSTDGVNWIKIGDASVGSKYISSTKEKITAAGADKSRRVKPGDFILSNSMSFGRPYIMATDGCIHDGWLLLRDISPRLNKDFLFSILGSVPVVQQFERGATGGVVNNLNSSIVRGVRIPLPPLELQGELVAEIESYQKILDGARAVVENYRPRIEIDPKWPMVELNDIIDSLESGVSVNSTNRRMQGDEIGILKTSCVTSGVFDPDENKAILPDERPRAKCSPKMNSIIVSRMNTEALVGANAYIDQDYENLFLPDRLWQTIITRADVDVRYVQHVLGSDAYRRKISALCGGTSGSMKNIAKGQFLSLSIPLPALKVQQTIAHELNGEQKFVDGNAELIERFEKKIQVVLARVWGASTEL